MENTNDVWQTEVNGQIYSTDLQGLAQWIAEGSLLPQDRVRRGNLRWIEARKIPALHGFFNAKELGIAPPVVSTVNPPTGQEIMPPQAFSLNSLNQFVAQQQTFNEPPPPQIYQDFANNSPADFCAIHANAKAAYHCETCSNYFCQACPSQNICPMCGAMCKSLNIPIPSPAFTPAPVSQTPIVEQIPDEVRKAANWFYWKAALTVLNGIIMLFGSAWAFFLGVTITQIFHGVADELTKMGGGQGVNIFHGLVFVFGLVCAGIIWMLGHFAAKGKKWALILGLIIYSFDGVIYLLTISSPSSIFGVLLHGIAIYTIVKGISSVKSKS